MQALFLTVHSVLSSAGTANYFDTVERLSSLKNLFIEDIVKEAYRTHCSLNECASRYFSGVPLRRHRSLGNPSFKSERYSVLSAIERHAPSMLKTPLDISELVEVLETFFRTLFENCLIANHNPKYSNSLETAVTMDTIGKYIEANPQWRDFFQEKNIAVVTHSDQVNLNLREHALTAHARAYIQLILVGLLREEPS
jgi:hypothetical protein